MYNCENTVCPPIKNVIKRSVDEYLSTAIFAEIVIKVYYSVLFSIIRNI